jgi:integrase/recombinase XerD
MGEITLKKALDDYKTIFMPYRNFADRTREEYLNDLQGFVTYLEQAGVGDVRDIGLPIVERYAAHLEYEGFASLTRKRKIVAVRSFLSFLHQDGYIETNLASKVVLPYAESPVPNVLTQVECDRLRKVCAMNVRDRAMIELLLQTGIKLSELIALKVDDIDIEPIKEYSAKQTGYMRILESRGKPERSIPLNTKACDALSRYRDERRHSDITIFFLNRFGEPMQERGIQKMLRKYLKIAKIGNAGIQTLRHTFGAHHIAKGTELKTVQEVMGLKDTRSVSIYQSLAKELVSKELQENAL